MTYKNADGFFENAKYFQIRVRGAVEEHTDGVESSKCCEVKRILALPGQVYVDFIEDTVPEVGLLV